MRGGLKEVSLLIGVAREAKRGARLGVERNVGFVARVARDATHLSAFMRGTCPMLLGATFVARRANLVAFSQGLFVHEALHVFFERELGFFFGGVAHMAQDFTVAGGTVVTWRTAVFDSMARIGIVLYGVRVARIARGFVDSSRCRSRGLNEKAPKPNITSTSPWRTNRFAADMLFSLSFLWIFL